MSKKIKLCYFQIIDGSEKEVQKLSKELGKIKDTVGMEFLVGNERIELHNVKYLCFMVE